MNLVEITADRIISHVLATGHSEKDWRVLVIDHITAKLLHHSLPLSEVLSKNIAMVERIEENRARSNEFSVIYFISATAQNIKKIEKDISNKLYRDVFVISVTGIQKKEEQALDAIARKVESQQKKKKTDFSFTYKAVLFDFIPLEPDLFYMESPYSYYSDRSKYLGEIADRIKGMCKTLRIQITPVPVGLYAKKLADQIESTGPSKLVIIERGLDMNTPLLHTFTFESLLWDLDLAGPGYVVEKEGHVDEEEGEEKEGEEDSEDDSDHEKRLELNEDYKVWKSVRNKQLVETHRVLADLIKDETQTRKEEGKTNIKKLVKAVQELPSQTRMLKEIKVLMALLERCVGFFNLDGIKETAELEQGIATGRDSRGGSFKSAATKMLLNVLRTAKLRSSEKYRLYLLYLMSYGSLQRHEEKRLIEKGALTQKEIDQGEVIKIHLAGRKIKSLSKRTLPIGRHVPLVADVLQAIIDKDSASCGKLEIDVPCHTDILTGASLRKREFVFKATPEVKTVHRRVIILYVIGGVSIAEVSEIREIARKTGKVIVVGSTAVCSPNAFVETLKALQ